MKVELNICLTIPGRSNTLAECTARAREVLQILRTAGLRYSAERIVPRMDRARAAAELHDVLIVETDVAALTGMRIARALAYEIANLLEQNAVAIYTPTHDIGELVGPGAKRHGDFDMKKFLRFADVALPRAA